MLQILRSDVFIERPTIKDIKLNKTNITRGTNKGYIIIRSPQSC